jgi:hypothetical protein
MRFITADVIVHGESKHFAAHTVRELLAAMPTDHTPANVVFEDRRPTIAERQQLWSAEQSLPGTLTETVKQAMDREARTD